MERLQSNERVLLRSLQRLYSAHGGVFRLSVDFHEPVSRRAGRSQFALLLFERCAAGCAGGGEVHLRSRDIDDSVHRNDSYCNAAALLPALLFAERALLY